MSESRLQEVGPVSLADYPTIDWETYPVPSLSPFTLNEQLSLFATGDEAGPPRAHLGRWAPLAFALVILPWALIGWMIWALT